MAWKNIQNSPLFIGGHRKCGTTMFVSLLDGHKDLFIYPSESGFFYKFYPLFDSNQYSYEEKEVRMTEQIFKTLDEVVREWIGVDACPNYSFDKFLECFRSRVTGTNKESKDFLDALFYSAYETLISRSHESKKYWVEKTTSIEMYANTLFNWYSQAKFIHIIRDPRDNYGAIKAGWDQNYQQQFDCKERLLQSVIDRARLGMELAEVNQQRFGREKYHIVRYEDVVSSPEETLSKACAFLGIDFQPCLLKPTFCGVPWKGNNYETKKFDSISKSSVNRWKERIDEHEAKVLEFHFQDLMKKNNYVPVYDIQESADAAREHYKWFNFAQSYSLKLDKVYR